MKTESMMRYVVAILAMAAWLVLVYLGKAPADGFVNVLMIAVGGALGGAGVDAIHRRNNQQ